MLLRMTKSAHDVARRHLKSVDPILGKVIDVATVSSSAWKGSRFRALTESILSQQLSGKAATTITNRFRKLFPGKSFPTPKDILTIPTQKIRSAGVSGAKTGFIKDLAARLEDGRLSLRSIHLLDNEEAIKKLIEVKGIGRWTAEMFLMFSLQRPDIFSYGDLGLKNAIKKLYRLKEHPTERAAAKITEKWKPYRTLASRYLWASLDLP
jgi:DNA-3-methyladenine glycosylase II